MEPAELETASDVDDDDDFEDSFDSGAASGDGGLADDDFQQEEEFNDTIKIQGVLTGEEWLTSNFLAGTNEATVQSATISRKISDLREDRLNRSDISKSRPVSPFGTDINPF